MSDMAKQARAAMKAKAKSLTTADPHQKVDSSTWTPPEPINAGVKTGLRPLSRRAFKSGGKVLGGKKANLGMSTRGGKKPITPDTMANKDVKAANMDRPGLKHVGGMKKGGRTCAYTGGDMELAAKEYGERTKMTPEERANLASPERAPVTAEQARRMREATGRKTGGRTKKMLGGPLMQPDGMMSAVGSGGGTIPTSPGQQGGVDPNDPRFKIVSPQAMNFGVGAKGTPYKRGGAAKHPDEKMDIALIKKMVKPEARAARKEGGGVFSGPGYPGKIPGVVPGGRTAKAAGGQTTTTKGKGKTNIRINIMSAPPAGGGDMLTPRMGPTPPPGAGGAGGGRPIAMPPTPGGPAGASPMPIPIPIPMGGMPGGAGGMPPGRKSGGRITKVAKSYKDMEAGAGGGEGRLQKTDIAKKHKDAPAFRKGGKVYRSYKDMDAGAGSGLGRLEKTEIQARKG